MYFYPRSPCGERLILHMAHLMEHLFLSTLSLRRATRLGLLGWLRVLISIHALLAESDAVTTFGAGSVRDFYPRSPCGERQGTAGRINGRINFYPRSPCGERRRGGDFCYLDNIISIHALLAESDVKLFRQNYECFISIHALLAESDIVIFRKRDTPSQFLSTLSLRRATMRSIGRDLRARNFYPRSPCGERLFCCFIVFLHFDFYPRSPCGERQFDITIVLLSSNFYPRSPCGERQG